MRIALPAALLVALLVGLLLATAACGAYRFPGADSGNGNVHGQVTAAGCGGPVQPDAGVCPARAALACPPPPPLEPPPPSQTCSKWPITGFELDFTSGSTTRVAKTDSAGAYSIDLPVGTWHVTAGNYGRIVDGPQTVTVGANASIAADYLVDTGIRAAA